MIDIFSQIFCPINIFHTRQIAHVFYLLEIHRLIMLLGGADRKENWVLIKRTPHSCYCQLFQTLFYPWLMKENCIDIQSNRILSVPLVMAQIFFPNFAPT